MIGEKEKDVKVLFVDDDEGILIIIKEIFSNTNFDILTATSARQGLNILEHEENVPVVFSDYNMPSMDGVTFLQEVCKRWPCTVRIMCSGDINAEPITSAVNKGHIYKCISKPWNDSKLKEIVSDAVKRYTHRSQFGIPAAKNGVLVQ